MPTALVTGAGSGIGRAVSRALAAVGHQVVLVGRHAERLAETRLAIEAAGGRASVYPLDLERELEEIPRLAEWLRERFGTLEVLVNNAARSGQRTPLAEFDLALWEAIFRLNVTAPFYLTRCCLPLLLAAPAGTVINVTTSDLAVRGRALWGAYAASKAALRNLTETWADELRHTTVRINAVNPGTTATPMRAASFPQEDPALHPSPDQIVPVFLHLVSPAGRHLHGQHLEARDWLAKGD